MSATDLSAAARTRAERIARFQAQERALYATGERDPRLPDGRRLLRFFPDYAGLPVWRAGPDAEPRTRDQLLASGADEQLVDDLAAWDAANRGHEDGWTETREGQEWVAARLPLLARLRAAVAPACEAYAYGD